MLRRLLLLSAIALAGCGGSDAPVNSAHAQAQPPTPAARRVLGIGDSIMAGYIPGDGVSERLAPGESFMRELAPLGEVVSAPVGGASTDAALRNQVAWATTPFDPALPAVEPGIVVVMLGTNDAVMGVPLAISIDNVRQILERFPTSVRVLVSPPHWSEDTDPWMAAWSSGLSDLARRNGAIFVDAYTPSLARPGWQCTVNNRHPCEPAHREIGRLVAAAIQRTPATL